MASVNKLTVFYDGACPLCDREITFYRRCKGAEEVSWVDVSRCPEDDIVPGLSKDEALARFHVMTAAGTLISGSRAFAELWAALPRFRLFGRIFRAGIFARVLDRAYIIFLRVRPQLQTRSKLSSTWPRPGLLRKFCAKVLVGIGLFGAIFLQTMEARAQSGDMLIDDFSSQDFVSKLGTRWRGVSDQVMGGISEASVAQGMIDGRPCLRLTGDVRLENDGGFIQAALDLALSGDTLDASGYTGVRLVVRGNGERYSVHLRTPDNVRPWQSYRAHFMAGSDWQAIELPFETFAPYRLDAPLDITRLRRIGLVAIGRAFYADLAISELSFYR